MSTYARLVDLGSNLLADISRSNRHRGDVVVRGIPNAPQASP